MPKRCRIGQFRVARGAAESAIRPFSQLSEVMKNLEMDNFWPLQYAGYDLFRCGPRQFRESSVVLPRNFRAFAPYRMRHTIYRMRHTILCVFRTIISGYAGYDLAEICVIITFSQRHERSEMPKKEKTEQKKTPWFRPNHAKPAKKSDLVSSKSRKTDPI